MIEVAVVTGILLTALLGIRLALLQSAQDFADNRKQTLGYNEIAPLVVNTPVATNTAAPTATVDQGDEELPPIDEGGDVPPVEDGGDLPSAEG